MGEPGHRRAVSVPARLPGQATAFDTVRVLSFGTGFSDVWYMRSGRDDITHGARLPARTR